jgi:hypothetical protein
MRQCSVPIGGYVWKPTPTRTPGVTVNRQSSETVLRTALLSHKGEEKSNETYCVLRVACCAFGSRNTQHATELGVQLLDHIGGDKNHTLGNISRPVG